MLTAGDVYSFLERIDAATSEWLSVYWFPVQGDRNDVRAYIASVRYAIPVVPIVVRAPIFSDPNSVLNDLVDLLNGNRQLIEQTINEHPACIDRAVFALISKSELCTPQLGSPVTLPAWFPFRAGNNISVVVKDVTWIADLPLSDGSSQVHELGELLVDLEDILVTRLTVSVAADHRRSNKLAEQFRAVDKSFSSLKDCLETAREARKRLRSNAGFRPSLARQEYIVSRLAAVGLNTTTAAMNRPAEALIEALAMASTPTLEYESLCAVLNRPQPYVKNEDRRLGRNILTTTMYSYQLITSAAHAEDYGRFPVIVLRSLSVDLRRSLEACIVALK